MFNLHLFPFTYIIIIIIIFYFFRGFYLFSQVFNPSEYLEEKNQIFTGVNIVELDL